MKELTLICGARMRRLPVRELAWLPERSRTPATQKGFRRGEKPPNWGKKYPATPPTKAEMLRVLEACGGGKVGTRNRGLMVVLWRAGLRCQEALDLLPHDIDYDQQTVVVLSGKGGKRRVVGIDLWALEQLQDWYAVRVGLGIPDGSPLFCAVSAGSVGRPLKGTYVRALVKKLQRRAQIPHRMAPHQLRHALACDLAREGAHLHLLSRQLGHSHLGTTATYLQAISNEEVVSMMAVRQAPFEVVA